MSTSALWKRYQQYLCQIPSLGLTLDVSRIRFEDGFLDRMAAPVQQAFEAMDALERGSIANPDEKRMVGHYWLRAPELAPSPAIAAEIRGTLAEIERFAGDVHDGILRTPEGRRFTHVLSIGIGGSALGPLMRGYGYTPHYVEGGDPAKMHQLMAQALDRVVGEIKAIQADARTSGFASRPSWPMIVFRSPKGWTGPKEVDGKKTEGYWRSHQVPMADMTRPGHLQLMEA